MPDAGHLMLVKENRFALLFIIKLIEYLSREIRQSISLGPFFNQYPETSNEHHDVLFAYCCE